MIQNNILEKLEFSKILQNISKYASTEPGKNEILELKPHYNKLLAEMEGTYVNEAKEILIKNDVPPIDYLPDLSDDLSRSGIEGASLQAKSILEILRLAEISRRIFQFLKSQPDSPHLNNDYLNRLFVDKMFEHHISKVIDENGEVRDSASMKLREIRSDIKKKKDSLSKVINRILKDLSDSFLVREEYITQRDGRMVVPIKSEHKRHVKGFIHSESSTGQTVYIEPEETLELNNDILSLNFAEKREIERILKELTKKIGESSDRLKDSLNTIASLDCIFARAKYSTEIIGAFPSIDEKLPLKILDGRHPLLLKRISRNKTVPLNLEINKDNVILITGPNAGGKTVVLKTIGLLAVMTMSGIHIPVSPDTNMHFFDDILIDIGDQQSIEDDLSTFSSHLSNIRKILNEANNKSLVLVDEIGTGTDPAEGSALATAVLLILQKKGATVLATTHHGSLKLIANEIEGFQNASMEFDTENLVPTYKFRQGVPGSSYAFEVAGRIGFDRSFIELAKEYLNSDKMKVEDFLIELETRSKSLEKKLKEYEIENSRLKGLTNLYQQNIEKLENQKRDILKEAKNKADEYLRDINKRVEDAVRQIKESNANADKIKEARRKIEEIKVENKEKVKQDFGTEIKNIILSVGDYVTIKNSSASGKILEIDSAKNKASVLAGSIKLQVKLEDLIPARKKEVEEKPVYRSDYFVPSANIKIDVRGKKPEEAEYELIRFVDDAYSAGLNRIEILHGKGTGVLKKLVKEILSNHIGVKQFYFANIEHGGEGITIVELK